MRNIFQFLSLLIICSFVSPHSFAQCKSEVALRLQNIKGGFYGNQKVTLKSKVDGKTYIQNSDARGEASLMVPCNELFELTVANYTTKMDVESPVEGGKTRHTLSYEPDMLLKQKRLAMSQPEKDALDNNFSSLPDTTEMKTSIMPPPAKMPDYYAMVILTIRDINGAPLQNEKLWMTGRKRKKATQAITDKNGRVITYLPKGDTYDVNFKYHKAYYYTECDYSKGSTDIKLNFSYLGSKEIEKRRKEEAERIAKEEKRLKEERERFEKACSAMGLTLEECHKKEIEDMLKSQSEMIDTVIYEVMKRNQWQDKLIMCDVTGSMSPYVGQLALWYRLNHARENNLQFVLFNDGDNMPDEKKKIGETGGIYYARSKVVDSLDAFMSKVQALGSGGDCPENNIEALIKGMKMASPFKDVIMIVDNYAPIKDIQLLSQVKTPVHVILCGANNVGIQPDYLKLAWRTKGTIHTIEEDIANLARLSEGQQITIAGWKYKIMGGDFVPVSK
jgi:hypothetical protein